MFNWRDLTTCARNLINLCFYRNCNPRCYSAVFISMEFLSDTRVRHHNTTTLWPTLSHYDWGYVHSIYGLYTSADVSNSCTRKIASNVNSHCWNGRFSSVITYQILFSCKLWSKQDTVTITKDGLLFVILYFPSVIRRYCKTIFTFCPRGSILLWFRSQWFSRFSHETGRFMFDMQQKFCWDQVSF